MLARWNQVALAALLFLALGALLLFEPVGSGPSNSAHLASGSPIELAVPASVDLGAAPDLLYVQWSAGSCSGDTPCPTAGGPVELLVLDCGTSSCANRSGVPVEQALWLGSDDVGSVDVVPGDSYEIELGGNSGGSTLDAPSLSVAYSLAEPLFGGIPGALLLGGGALLLVTGLYDRFPRRPRPLGTARFPSATHERASWEDASPPPRAVPSGGRSGAVRI
jgi:hypothetical protein